MGIALELNTTVEKGMVYGGKATILVSNYDKAYDNCKGTKFVCYTMQFFMEYIYESLYA